MTAGTATLDDIHRALLLSQRAALLAMLPVVVTRPSLKAGAVQWLGAIEDELEMERTIPSRTERRHSSTAAQIHTPTKERLCACGCGQETAWDSETRRWYPYVMEHKP